MKKAIIFAFGVSCISGSAPQLKKLIPRQYNAEATRKLQETILTSESNDLTKATFLKSLEQLIKDGADPNMIVKAKEGATSGPLMILLAQLSYDSKIDFSVLENLINTALSNGAHVDVTDPDSGNTTLFYTIVNGSPGMIKLLLDHGADLSRKNKGGEDVANYAKKQLDHKKGQLERYKKDIPRTEKEIERLQKIITILGSKPTKENLKPVTTSYSNEATQKLQEKLNAIESEEDFTKSLFLKEIDQLIKAGANPNLSLQLKHKNQFGQDKVDDAIIRFLVRGPYFSENVDFALLESVVENALSHGAKTMVYDLEDENPLLFHAITIDSPGIVKLLVDYGADLNYKNDKGSSAIDHAKEQLNLKKTLLEQYKTRDTTDVKNDIDRWQKIVDVIEQNKTKAKHVLIK